MPELRVRRLLHALGYRFRLHRADLPGKPDIVLPKYRLCVFVHGCFWHQHPGCKRGSFPSTNREFWTRKFDQNRTRDANIVSALGKAGWRVSVIWECQTKDDNTLSATIARSLAELRSANVCKSDPHKKQKLKPAGSSRTPGPRAGLGT